MRLTQKVNVKFKVTNPRTTLGFYYLEARHKRIWPMNWGVFGYRVCQWVGVSFLCADITCASLGWKGGRLQKVNPSTHEHASNMIMFVCVLCARCNERARPLQEALRALSREPCALSRSLDSFQGALMWGGTLCKSAHTNTNENENTHTSWLTNSLK